MGVKKKKYTYKLVASLMIVFIGYIQAVEFIHTSHSSHTLIESVQKESKFANNKDLSCLICYYLQHSAAIHLYYSSANISLNYEPVLTILYVNNSHKPLLSHLKKRNNKSPPWKELFS